MQRLLTFLSRHLLPSGHPAQTRPGRYVATQRAPRLFDLAELEDRILLSAAPIPLEVTAEKVDAVNAVDSAADAAAGTLAPAAAPTSDANTNSPTAGTDTRAAAPASAVAARADGARHPGGEHPAIADGPPVARGSSWATGSRSTRCPPGQSRPRPHADDDDDRKYRPGRGADLRRSSVAFDPIFSQLTIRGDAGDNAAQPVIHSRWVPDGHAGRADAIGAAALALLRSALAAHRGPLSARSSCLVPADKTG